MRPKSHLSMEDFLLKKVFLDKRAFRSDRTEVLTGKHREIDVASVIYDQNSQSFSTPIVNGWRMPLSYSSRITELSPGVGSYRSYYMKTPETNELRFTGTGCVFPSMADFSFGPGPYEKLLLKQQSAIGALRKVGHRKASFGIMAAELRQTSSMVASRAVMIYRSYKLARKGQFRTASKVILDGLSGTQRKHFMSSRGVRRSKNYKNASQLGDAGFNSWLELQFGWQQLLKDATDAINVLKAIDDIRKLPRCTGVSTRVVRSNGSRHNLLSLYTGSSLPQRIPTTHQCISEYIVKSRADYAIGNLDHFMSDSFGINNPLEVAWDLLPYSFVLDWFLPIGDALAALNSTTGLTKLGNSVTEYTAEKRDYFCTPNIPSNFDRNWTEPQIKGSIAQFNHMRSTVPLGFLAVLPLIRLPDSLWHAITSVALINQRR